MVNDNIHPIANDIANINAANLFIFYNNRDREMINISRERAGRGKAGQVLVGQEEISRDIVG